MVLRFLYVYHNSLSLSTIDEIMNKITGKNLNISKNHPNKPTIDTDMILLLVSCPKDMSGDIFVRTRNKLLSRFGHCCHQVGDIHQVLFIVMVRYTVCSIETCVCVICNKMCSEWKSRSEFHLATCHTNYLVALNKSVYAVDIFILWVDFLLQYEKNFKGLLQWDIFPPAGPTLDTCFFSM